MPVTLQGMVDTLDGNQGSRVWDITTQIATVTMFKPVIFNLMLQNFMPTNQYRYQWDEIDIIGPRTTINATGGYGAGDTALVVTDASIFTAKDVVRNLRTNKNYRIVSINYSTNTLTVYRDPAGDATINHLDVLQNAGSAFEQGSALPDAKTANSATVYNFTQIFRKTVSATGTELRNVANPGAGLDQLKLRMYEEFNNALEGAAIFGKRWEDTTNYAHPQHQSKGVYDTITTNVESVGGTTITEDEWVDFLIDYAFYRGSDTKLFVCGDNFFRCLATWGKQYLRTTLSDKVLGINVAEYITPTGQTLQIYRHPLFVGDATLAGTGIVLDVNSGDLGARYSLSNPAVPYGGRITQLDNREPVGTDGVISEVFAELGFELKNEIRHAKITGVTGPTP